MEVPSRLVYSAEGKGVRFESGRKENTDEPMVRTIKGRSKLRVYMGQGCEK